MRPRALPRPQKEHTHYTDNKQTLRAHRTVSCATARCHSFIHLESVRAPRAARRLFLHKSVLQPSLKRSGSNRRIRQLLSPHSFVVGDVGFAAAFRRLLEPLRVALVEH